MRLVVVDVVAAVSIHASAREATGCGRFRLRVGRVSIHASAREATGCERRFPALTMVSIHASAREATFVSCTSLCGCRSFDPRLREGGDPCLLELADFSRSFDPRLREGGDRLGAVCGASAVVSIHASAREATPGALATYHSKQGFDPRLREGGDYRSASVIPRLQSFDPRLREGGDGTYAAGRAP